MNLTKTQGPGPVHGGPRPALPEASAAAFAHENPPLGAGRGVLGLGDLGRLPHNILVGQIFTEAAKDAPFLRRLARVNRMGAHMAQETARTILVQDVQHTADIAHRAACEPLHIAAVLPRPFSRGQMVNAQGFMQHYALRARYRLVEELQRSTQRPAAQQLLENLVPSGLRSVEHWFRMAQNLEEMHGIADETTACFRRVLAQAPKTSRAYRQASAYLYLQRARRLMAHRHHQRAQRFVDKAIVASPHYSRAHCMLGDILRDRHELSHAEKSYRQALNLQSDHQQARLGLARVYGEQGKFAEALGEATILRQHDAPSELWQRLMGDLNFGQQRWNDAKQHYLALTRAQNPKAHDFVQLGIVCSKQGQWAEAEASFCSALALAPASRDIEARLALSMLEQNKACELRGRITAQLAPHAPGTP